MKGKFIKDRCKAMLARTMQHAQIQATSSRLKGSLIPPTYNSSTHSSKTTPEP